jgi:hypothetical protein
MRVFSGEVRRGLFLQKILPPEKVPKQPKIFWQWGCCGEGEGELDLMGVEAEVVEGELLFEPSVEFEVAVGLVAEDGEVVFGALEAELVGEAR